MVFRHVKLTLIVACGLALCVLGPAFGQFVELNNGIDRLTDGHLRVNPDAYGSWTASGFGGEGDEYNPVGSGIQLRQRAVIFSNGFFLFKDGTQRELLSESPNFQSSVNGEADLSLEREITTPNSVNAGVATSSFRVHDPVGTFDVSFDLEQSITQVGTTAVSILNQTYSITNNAAEAVSFQMVRAVDADLAFAAGMSTGDDEVGTNTNLSDPPGTTSVWQQDYPTLGPPEPTRLTVSGENNGGAYYGGLQGDMPGGVEPTMGFGTDTQVWDAYGVPTNWRNYVANLGYDMDGQSGEPAGQDAFVGLEFPIDLAASGSSSFTISFQYGEMPPPSGNCDFDNDGNCDGTDINLMMAAIAGGADPSEFDLNNDGSVNTGDRDEWLQIAGDMNIGAAYLVGDATLDGVVDGLDFIEWNNNKFSASTDWTAGEFTGDATVDGLDFIEWNTNKFMSSDVAAVPEPSSGLLLAMVLGVGMSIRRRR